MSLQHHPSHQDGPPCVHHRQDQRARTALLIPLPQPGDVTPEELYPDALEEAERARENYAFALEAQCDDFISPKPAG